MARLRDLIFFVTRRCDLRCRTCFYAAEIDRPPLVDETELTLAEIDRVAANLSRLDSLLISGGEPFLREDLAEICAIFHRRCRIAAIHLPSNGQTPERIRDRSAEILGRLPGVHLTLSLPLDGLEAAHDRIKGLAGSFRNTVETVRCLSPLRKKFPAFQVYVITVVSRENLPGILSLAEWVKRHLEVDGHGPSPLRGRPRDPGLRPPLAEEWLELAAGLLPYHRHYLERSGRSRLRAVLAFNRVRYLYSLYGRVLAGGTLPFRCPAGERIAVLEPDGGVRRCELMPRIGNVRASDLDLLRVLHGPRAAQSRPSRSCACTHACFLERGIRSRAGSLARSLLGRREALHG